MTCDEFFSARVLELLNRVRWCIDGPLSLFVTLENGECFPLASYQNNQRSFGTVPKGIWLESEQFREERPVLGSIVALEDQESPITAPWLFSFAYGALLCANSL